MGRGWRLSRQRGPSPPYQAVGIKSKLGLGYLSPVSRLFMSRSWKVVHVAKAAATKHAYNNRMCIF